MFCITLYIPVKVDNIFRLFCIIFLYISPRRNFRPLFNLCVSISKARSVEIERATRISKRQSMNFLFPFRMLQNQVKICLKHLWLAWRGDLMLWSLHNKDLPFTSWRAKTSSYALFLFFILVHFMFMYLTTYNMFESRWLILITYK